MNLMKLYEAVFGDITLETAKEIILNLEIISLAQELTGAEIDTLLAAFKRGPLFDGDVPSKSGRDSLIEKGLVTKVVVKGEDGFNACTHKGKWVLRVFQMMPDN